MRVVEPGMVVGSRCALAVRLSEERAAERAPPSRGEAARGREGGVAWSDPHSGGDEHQTSTAATLPPRRAEPSHAQKISAHARQRGTAE